MASATASPNYHGQLTANTIDTITMSQIWSSIQIIASETTAPARIDYTIDGSAPVVGGSPAGRVLPATPCVDVVSPGSVTVIAIVAGGETSTTGPMIIKLVSAGTPHYEIIGGS